MTEMLHPAIALFELGSIAVGICTGDAMVKRAPVDVLYAGTVHPGKYLILVGGDVASVEEAVFAADDAIDDCATHPIDRLLLPDVHPDVVAALRGHCTSDRQEAAFGEAIGIFETATVCATLLGADHGIKGADVLLRDVHLADDLGGKAYCLFEGTVADVEAALERANDSAAMDSVAKDRVAKDVVCGSVLIPRLADEMRANLNRAPRFSDLVRGAPEDAKT